jgi:hypothetical protein
MEMCGHESRANSPFLWFGASQNCFYTFRPCKCALGLKEEHIHRTLASPFAPWAEAQSDLLVRILPSALLGQPFHPR